MPKDETLEMTLKRLRLFGLLARIDEIRNAPWLKQVLTIEDEEKTRRSLAHRVHSNRSTKRRSRRGEMGSSSSSSWNRSDQLGVAFSSAVSGGGTVIGPT